MARLIVALIVSAVFTHAVFCSTISVGDASDDLAWEPTQGPEFDEFAEQVYYPEMPPDTPVVEQAVDADPGRDRGKFVVFQYLFSLFSRRYPLSCRI